jgi:predicted transcriptional regulator YdeE
LKIEIVKRDAFQVCGYAVPTTLREYGREGNRAELINNYRTHDPSGELSKLSDTPDELFALAWYASPGKVIEYLLGYAVPDGTVAPEGALVKHVAPATYAVGSFDAGTDIVRIWTEFYYEAGSTAGFQPDLQHDVWFEYYPEGLNGRYQLWIAVTQK